MTNALSYALLVFIVAIIAAVLGFGGVLSPDQGGISRSVFIVAIVLFVVFLVAGLTRCRCAVCDWYSKQYKSKDPGAAK